MLKKFMTAIIIVIAAAALGDGALAQIEEEKAKTCDPENLVQSGTIKFDMRSVGFLIGVRWGDGVLTLKNGEQHKIDVTGGKLLETGDAKADFEGEVYNLKNLQDIEGTYYGASTKITVIEGKGQLQTNNANCVFIRARATGGGLQLSGPAPEGIQFKLEK